MGTKCVSRRFMRFLQIINIDVNRDKIGDLNFRYFFIRHLNYITHKTNLFPIQW